MPDYLFRYRKRHRKKGSGSRLITLIIYGLTCYIICNFLSAGLKKVVSQDMLIKQIKKLAGSNILYINYIYKDDNDILKQKTYVSKLLEKILNSPANDYYDKKVPVNVATDKNILFYLSNESANELNDAVYSDKRDDLNKNSMDTDKNQEESVDEKDSEGEDIIENQSDIAKSVSGALTDYTKKKEIHTEELTYEYLMKNFYTVVSGTTLYESDIEAEKLMNIDMTLKTKNNEPQILIYHTHGQEGFADSISGDANTGIIGVGNYLVELLANQYGYNVIHITDSFDYVNGVLDRSKAYDYAYEKIAQVLADNPSIEVVIDLHRDGVNENLHLVTEVNGKPTAKIMFFNGISRLNSIGEIGYLYNPYRQENLAMSLQMKVLAEEYFEGFTRKNYIQAYQYNLHLRPKSMLIEAGAQTNTFEEVKNAMEPLAFLISKLLSGSN